MDLEKKPVRARVDCHAGASGDGVDRIVLRREEARKLESWLKDLNLRFEGMIRATKSDLANFLIRHHSDTLSEAEIGLLEAELFDEVRWLNWALCKIREAKKQGRVLSLEDLMVKRRVACHSKATTTKRARNKPTTGANEDIHGANSSEANAVSPSGTDSR